MVFFDPATVDKGDIVEVIPEGQYVALIEKTKLKQNNNGLGACVFFKVLSKNPSINNVSVMEYFNIEHMTDKVAKAGRKKFLQLLVAIGMGLKPIEDPSAIENNYVKIDVTIEPHYKYPSQTQNKVQGFHPLSQAELVRLQPAPSDDDDVPF